ncbi:MAG: DMT family transporter [Candidatus Rhabdochlamydia sp.]
MASIKPVPHLHLAIPSMLIACFIYALLSAAIKQEMGQLSVQGILFWRYLLSFLFFIPWMMYQNRGSKLDLKPGSWFLYIVRVLASMASIYLYCAALRNLSVGMTSLLYNMLPLFVPLITYLWKKVPIDHKLWWGFGVSVIGVIVVLMPGKVEWNYGMFLAIVAGIFGAISLVSIRFAHYEEPPYRINFYVFLLAFLFTAPLTLLNVQRSWGNLSLSQFLPLFFIGVTGFLYQQLYTYALKHAPARFLAPLMYSTVIWAVLLDNFLWGTSFSVTTWIGTLLIILGNVLIYLLYPKRELSS